MRLDLEALRQRFGAEEISSWREFMASAAFGEATESRGGVSSSVQLPADLPVIAPGNLEAAAEVLRFASHERLHVLPAGSGEHRQMGAPDIGAELVLSMRRCRRIVEYEPEEMTLVAEAGVTLHELEALTAPHGQRLGPDPWPGRAATLGGAVATNRAGLNRLARGTLRDAVLGARVLHVDGNASRTGGKVVKNVAGFDLAKLYVGSRGSLALIAEVNVRLVPRPRATAMVLATLDREPAPDLLLQLRRSALQPASLVLVAGHVHADLRLVPHRVLVLARFEGAPSAVRWQVQECSSALPGAVELPEESAGATYDALRRFIEPEPETALLRISSLPIAAAEILKSFETVASLGDGLLVQFGTGTSHARLVRPKPAQLANLHARLAKIGARMQVEAAPPGLELPVEAPLDPAVLALQRGIKSAYDPEARLRPAMIPGDPA